LAAWLLTRHACYGFDAYVDRPVVSGHGGGPVLTRQALEDLELPLRAAAAEQGGQRRPECSGVDPPVLPGEFLGVFAPLVVVLPVTNLCQDSSPAACPAAALRCCDS